MRTERLPDRIYMPEIAKRWIVDRDGVCFMLTTMQSWPLAVGSLCYSSLEPRSMVPSIPSWQTAPVVTQTRILGNIPGKDGSLQKKRQTKKRELRNCGVLARIAVTSMQKQVPYEDMMVVPLMPMEMLATITIATAIVIRADPRMVVEEEIAGSTVHIACKEMLRPMTVVDLNRTIY